MEFSSISISVLLWTKFVLLLAFISSLRSFFNVSKAMFLCCMFFTSMRNSSESMEMSGFFIPAASNMSTTGSVTSARSMTCLTAVSRSSPPLRASDLSNLTSRAFTAWKNATSSLTAMASSWGTAMEKAFDSAVTCSINRFLPSFKAKDVLFRRKDYGKLLRCVRRKIAPIVKPVEHLRDNL